jgi:hypothetical protein
VLEIIQESPETENQTREKDEADMFKD